MTLESISLMSNYNELNRKVKKGEKKRQKQRSDRRIELFGERKDEEMKLHFQLFSFICLHKWFDGLVFLVWKNCRNCKGLHCSAFGTDNHGD